MPYIDAGGGTLVDQQIMATCGSGCRGTLDVREYSVWLTPAS
jgi:hypothetical protein